MRPPTVVTVCALIAAFNEERHVGQVVAGVRRYVSHVVLVDDGSTDQTAASAEASGATVLRHDRNLGKGSAIRTGLAHVLRLPFAYVLFLDADLQHDPGEIPKLLAAVEDGASDFVLGERGFAKDAMPAARFYSNVIGSRILSWFIGADVADSQSGFRLIRADLLRQVTLTSRGYEIETEMLIKLTRAGARLHRIRVTRLHYDGARSHIRPFRDTVRTCMLAVRYRFFPDWS